jgi:hypothetical protein
MARQRKPTGPCHVGYSRLYRRDLLDMRLSVLDPKATSAAQESCGAYCAPNPASPLADLRARRSEN